jgi:hypothetical protein
MSNQFTLSTRIREPVSVRPLLTGENGKGRVRAPLSGVLHVAVNSECSQSFSDNEQKEFTTIIVWSQWCGYMKRTI